MWLGDRGAERLHTQEHQGAAGMGWRDNRHGGRDRRLDGRVHGESGEVTKLKDYLGLTGRRVEGRVIFDNRQKRVVVR